MQFTALRVKSENISYIVISIDVKESLTKCKNAFD